MEDRRYADGSSRSAPLSERLFAARYSRGLLMLYVLLANLRDPHTLWSNPLLPFEQVGGSSPGACYGCYP
jgi:hypothetical protein